ELIDGIAGIQPYAGTIPLYSTITGAMADTATMDPEFWYRNLRQTVQFAPAIRAMAQAGIDTLIEISPHPVLTAPALETMEAELGGAAAPVTLASLRRDQGGIERFVASLAEAHVHGVRVDWQPLFTGAPRVDLPSYAFQRQR